MTVSRGREWRCSSMPHVASVAVNGDETAAGDTSLSSFWGLRQSQCRTTGINQAKEAYLSNYREFALYETHGRCITGTEIRTIQQSSQLVMPEWWIISNGGDSRCWEKGKSRGDEGPCTSNGSPTPPLLYCRPVAGCGRLGITSAANIVFIGSCFQPRLARVLPSSTGSGFMAVRVDS